MIQKVTFVILALTFAAKASVVGRVPKAKSFLNVANTLIVGGRPALQGEAPYQLDFRFNGYHMCGASLVEVDGLQVGITAAHCIYSQNSPYEIVAGDINQADNTGIEQKRPVNKVVIHRNYTGYSLRNDIAILFFNQSFQLNENVKTVPLPNQGQVTAQGSLKVSGWGDLEYMGNSPDELQIVEIPLISDTFCQQAYQDYQITVDDNMICAGRSTGDISPCHGDSGGPAISDAGYLAGVVSWGHECGHPDYPGVFTKVAHFIDWIHATVQEYKGSS